MWNKFTSITADNLVVISWPIGLREFVISLIKINNGFSILKFAKWGTGELTVLYILLVKHRTDKLCIKWSHFIPYMKSFIDIKGPGDMNAGLKLDSSWHCWLRKFCSDAQTIYYVTCCTLLQVEQALDEPSQSMQFQRYKHLSAVHNIHMSVLAAYREHMPEQCISFDFKVLRLHSKPTHWAIVENRDLKTSAQSFVSSIHA